MKRRSAALRLAATLRHRVSRALASTGPLGLHGEMLLLSTGCEARARAIPAIELLAEQIGAGVRHDDHERGFTVAITAPAGTVEATINTSRNGAWLDVEGLPSLGVRMSPRKDGA